MSACRAAGDSPKETLETPRVVKQPGISALTRSMASSVASPSLRRSSWPEPSGKVRVSKIRSEASSPNSPMPMSAIRLQTSTFQSAVRAWPSSSMASAMSADPYRLAIGNSTSALRRPSSRLTELMTARPPRRLRADSTTSISVESTTSGSVDLVARWLTRLTMSAVPSRPT